MGKGKKQKDEEEVLGQIFDFIFTEAKKKPGKRKFVKPTGISTSGTMTDALAAALEKPGAFLTDQMMSSMNDALDIEIGRLNANESGSVKAKLTTGNIVNFFKDPNKFFDKPKQAAKEGAREAMRAAFLGKNVEELQARAWAHKYNLDLDTKQAIKGYYTVQNNGRNGIAAAAFATAAGADALGNTLNSEKGFIARRSMDLIENEILLKGGANVLSPQRRAEFEAAIRKDGKKGAETYLTSTFGNGAWTQRAIGRLNTLSNDMKVRLGDDKWDIKLFDESNYLALESRNLSSRAQDIRDYISSHKNLSPQEIANLQTGAKKLDQANVIVSGQHWNSDDLRNANVEMQRQISNAKTQLVAARKAGNKNGVGYFKKELRDLQKGKRELRSTQFWGTVGRTEGWVDSWKGLLGGVGAENAISSILDGSFYDSNANTLYYPFHNERALLPVFDQGVSFGSYKWNRLETDLDGKSIKKPQSYNSQIKIHIAQTKDANKNDLPLLTRQYNRAMTTVYYFTPKSLMRSLFVNGEGFVYLAYMKEQAFAKQFGIAENALNEDFAQLMKGDPAFIQSLLGKKFDLLNGKGKKSLTAQEIDKLRKGLAFRGKMAQIFSFGQRQRDKVKNWFNDKIFTNLRHKVYARISGRITNTVAKELLEQWLVKGGFEVIGKALAITILEAIGIGATGGLGTFLAPIVSGIVVDVLWEGAKVIVLTLLLVVFGVVGFVIFGTSSAIQAFNSQTYAYMNYAPGEVVNNPNFKGSSPIVGNDDPTTVNGHVLAPFIAGALPSGEKCLIGPASYRCSQGPYSGSGCSHAKVAAIDVVGVNYFYAPAFCGNNNCTVTYSASAYCSLGYAGGEVKFTASYGGNTYEFMLIHVSSIYGVGTKLSAGQAVARVMTHAETTNACSSGMHIHIQAKVNGIVVNPRDVLNSSVSAGGFGCNIGVCPNIICK